MAIQIPHAPQLTNDATLIVFVHYSAPAAQQHPVLGDCHRLALLGRTMLGAAYQNAICTVFPNLQGNVFLVSDFGIVPSRKWQTLTWPLHEQQHVNTTFPAFVNRWVTTYGWRRNMRGMPPNVNLNDQHVRWILAVGAARMLITGYGCDRKPSGSSRRTRARSSLSSRTARQCCSNGSTRS